MSCVAFSFRKQVSTSVQNRKSFNKRKQLLFKFASSYLSVSPLAWFTGHSSDTWQLGTHPSYMVLWDHPLGAHTRILPQLDSTYHERKACSSMICDNKPLHFLSNIDGKVAFGTSTASISLDKHVAVIFLYICFVCSLNF